MKKIVIFVFLFSVLLSLFSGCSALYYATMSPGQESQFIAVKGDLFGCPLREEAIGVPKNYRPIPLRRFSGVAWNGQEWNGQYFFGEGDTPDHRCYPKWAKEFRAREGNYDKYVSQYDYYEELILQYESGELPDSEEQSEEEESLGDSEWTDCVETDTGYRICKRKGE